jgi:hypothetical protein
VSALAFLTANWPYFLAACGGIAAVVGFLNHLLQVKKLRLEIEKLKRDQVDQQGVVKVATLAETERFGAVTRINRSRTAIFGFVLLCSAQLVQLQVQSPVVEALPIPAPTDQAGVVDCNANRLAAEAAADRAVAALSRRKAAVVGTGSAAACGIVMMGTMWFDGGVSTLACLAIGGAAGASATPIGDAGEVAQRVYIQSLDDRCRATAQRTN